MGQGGCEYLNCMSKREGNIGRLAPRQHFRSSSMQQLPGEDRDATRSRGAVKSRQIGQRVGRKNWERMADEQLPDIARHCQTSPVMLQGKQPWTMASIASISHAHPRLPTVLRTTVVPSPRERLAWKGEPEPCRGSISAGVGGAGLACVCSIPPPLIRWPPHPASHGLRPHLRVH
jgi:hypothetical protein